MTYISYTLGKESVIVFFNVAKNQLKDYDLMFPDISY